MQGPVFICLSKFTSLPHMVLSDPEIKPVASISQVEDDSENEEKNTRPKRGYKKKATKKPDLTRYETLTREDEQEKESLTNFEKTTVQETVMRPEDDPYFLSDISWYPLVICFGPAKASFIPYAKPAYRVFEREMHQNMPWLYWLPDTFFRAPGSDASSVAIALARLGGRVGFMGKLGLDKQGMALLNELKKNRVEIGCVKMDDSASTAVSHMKLTAVRNSLKAKCVRPAAEDSFSNSDIDLDVLKEVT